MKTMKIIAAALTLAIIAALLAATGAFAGGNCLDESEWDRIHDGHLKSTVHDIIGDNGWQALAPHEGVNGDYHMARGYNRCNGETWSIVGYKDLSGGDVVWRVVYKER